MTGHADWPLIRVSAAADASLRRTDRPQASGAASRSSVLLLSRWRGVDSGSPHWHQ